MKKTQTFTETDSLGITVCVLCRSGNRSGSDGYRCNSVLLRRYVHYGGSGRVPGGEYSDGVFLLQG